jgi:hypothetical protein
MQNVMSSESRILASRANGSKSVGPVTEEGKRVSSRNAQTHGLCSHTITIEGESVERFESMLLAMVEVLHPTDEIEMQIVEAMAVSKWRQLRLWEMSAASHSGEIRGQADISPEIVAENPANRAAKAFDSLAGHSRLANLGLRYESSFDRAYDRGLRQLKELRREKREISKRT